MSYKIQDFKDGETVLAADHLQKIENGIINNENSIEVVQKQLLSIHHPLDGLNVLCLGDSITAGQGLTTATRWANILATKYNWTLRVNAAGGLALSSYWYTNNNSSDYSIATKADIVKTMSPKPDIVIVWGGQNDISYKYAPLGNWSDDKNSFKGALKYIAQIVHEYAPKATLFVLTLEWLNFEASTLKVPEGTTDTSNDFNKAIMDGAYLYGWIPINMQQCGITPYTKGTYTKDGIHPNESGTDLIVKYLSNELSKHYRIPDLDKVSVENISLNKATTTILKGNTETLITSITPSNATNTSIIWSSSNSNVATVDSSGKITGVDVGTTTITAKTADGGLMTSCIVNVSNVAVAATGITLDKTQYTCQQSTEFVLAVSFEPSNATNQNIIWNSSNTNVATVSGGFVKALREGNATITATSADGGHTATCNLTVTV